jgi:hypothetical protein
VAALITYVAWNSSTRSDTATLATSGRRKRRKEEQEGEEEQEQEVQPPNLTEDGAMEIFITHNLFQPEKILSFFSIATPQTKILHHPPILLVDENTTTFRFFF